MMNPRNKKTGCLIVVSGPSGTGKSTIVNTVLDTCNDLSFSVSATTRQQREGETEGVDYFFVTKERFQQMIDNNELLEHAEYVGNYYGTPRKAVLDKIENGSSILLDIEVQGAEQVKDQFPEAVTMFVIPPSWEELERRLVNRGTDSMEKIQRMPMLIISTVRGLLWMYLQIINIKRSYYANRNSSDIDGI